MENFILLALSLGLGLFLRQIPAFPKTAYQGLNAFIIYISLPAITLNYIPQMDFQWAYLYPFLSGWIIFGGAFVFFSMLGQVLHLDRATKACLILTCGLGNISFVGFPVVEALYGPAGLKIAILIDQGTFLALSIAGVAVAMVYSEGKIEGKLILRKIISFPPFIAFLLALTLIPVGIPLVLQNVLAKLGSTLSPLALVSVGLQIKIQSDFFKNKALYLGLGYKLICAPLLIYTLFFLLAGEHSLIGKVSLTEASMAPMVTAAILATQYQLNPRLANLLVGIGIPLSLPGIFLGYYLLNP